MTAVEDMLTKLDETAQIMKDLDETRSRLAGYRATKQQYSDLVATEIINRDALVAASKTAMQGLAAAINAAYPAP